MVFGTPFDSYLDPGEHLLWSGQPKQGIRLQATDVIMIPFSLMWGGFAFFWEALALGLVPMSGKHGHTNAAPIFMALWGIPFCLIGLYMIFGRFFGDALTRRKTWYGFTDKRVIVLRSFLSTSVTSIDYANLTNLNLVERGDRSGDILFGQDLAMMLTGGNFGRARSSRLLPGFYLLPDARNIYNQLREVQQNARK
jgi:hypothetical protein